MVRGLATGQAEHHGTPPHSHTPPEKDRTVRRLDGQDRSGDRWLRCLPGVRWYQVVRTGSCQVSKVSVGVPSAFLARPYAKSVPNQVKNR